MKYLGILLLSVLTFVACSNSLTPPDAGAPSCVREVRQVFHADVDFAPLERQAILEAAAQWASFSSGHVKQEVRFDLSFEDLLSLEWFLHSGDAVLVRLDASDESVQEADATLCPNGKPTCQVLAWTSDTPLRIFAVPSRVSSADEFRGVIQHEFGHAAGLRWPGCTEGKCFHTDPRNGPSLMTPTRSGLNDFTEADLAFCRASCLCP